MIPAGGTVVLLRRLGFLYPLTLPLVVLVGYRAGGAWNFLVPAWVFGVLPLLDWRGGIDTQTVLPRGTPGRVWPRFFDAILYAWVPIQLALVVWGAAAVGGLDGLAARVGFTISVGVLTGGIGIVVAHELGHRRGRAERALACTLLASVAYAHFYIEHNQGHHARVATPADPATARAGESFWRFLPRTLAGGFASAWEIERARLAARGHALWGPANRMLWVVLAPLVAAVGLGLAWGAPAAGFFVLQAAVAVTLLEAVNYLEHYGLVRRRHSGGTSATTTIDA